jgi:hypothetical protein
MRKRILAVSLAVGALGVLPATAAQAKTKKAPPRACVERTVGKLHIQIGLCP